MKNTRWLLPALPALCLTLVFSTGCSKTPEELGDKYLKLAEMTDNPRAKEEREKKAYFKYLDGVNYLARSGKPIPEALKEKLLKLTLRKLNRELARYSENPEEANLLQMNLWREDFDKYLSGLKSREIAEGYSQFLIAYANPEWMETDDAIKVLEEVVKLEVQAPAAREKIAQIRGKFAGDVLAEVQGMIDQTKEGIKKKDASAKDNLVFGEYKVLLALKQDPSNARARAMLTEIRELLLDTYSGYEKFDPNLDPEIDKYDIYLCIPKKSVSGKNVQMQVALWNLSSSPVTVRRENFSLVTEKNETIPAAATSRFDKILVDIKTDTAQYVNFTLKDGKAKIKNLLFRNEGKVSEKFFR